MKDEPIVLPAAGFTANWTNPATGVNYPTAWFQVMGNKFSFNVSSIISWQVYTSLSDYEAGQPPVVQNQTYTVNIADILWSDYFDASVCDLQAQTIACLHKFYDPSQSTKLILPAAGFTFPWEQGGTQYPDAWFQCTENNFAMNQWGVIKYSIFASEQAFLNGYSAVNPDQYLGVGKDGIDGLYMEFFDTEVCDIEEKTINCLQAIIIQPEKIN